MTITPVPKPAPREKKPKQPIKRSALKKKPKTPARWAYQYGSKERVEWVKTLQCFGLHFSAGPCVGKKENCHTAQRSGMGLKGHYSTIVCGCVRHHGMYDRHLAPFNREGVRLDVQHIANLTEMAWEDRAHE